MVLPLSIAESNKIWQESHSIFKEPDSAKLKEENIMEELLSKESKHLKSKMKSKDAASDEELKKRETEQNLLNSQCDTMQDSVMLMGSPEPDEDSILKQVDAFETISIKEDTFVDKLQVNEADKNLNGSSNQINKAQDKNNSTPIKENPDSNPSSPTTQATHFENSLAYLSIVYGNHEYEPVYPSLKGNKKLFKSVSTPKLQPLRNSSAPSIRGDSVHLSVKQTSSEMKNHANPSTFWISSSIVNISELQRPKTHMIFFKKPEMFASKTPTNYEVPLNNQDLHNAKNLGRASSLPRIITASKSDSKLSINLINHELNSQKKASIAHVVSPIASQIRCINHYSLPKVPSLPRKLQSDPEGVNLRKSISNSMLLMRSTSPHVPVPVRDGSFFSTYSSLFEQSVGVFTSKNEREYIQPKLSSPIDNQSSWGRKKSILS